MRKSMWRIRVYYTLRTERVYEAECKLLVEKRD